MLVPAPQYEKFSPEWSTSQLVRMLIRNTRCLFKGEVVTITEVRHYLSPNKFNKKLSTVTLSNEMVLQVGCKVAAAPEPVKAFLPEI